MCENDDDNSEFKIQIAHQHYNDKLISTSMNLDFLKNQRNKQF
jgi:hypothetical protein